MDTQQIIAAVFSGTFADKIVKAAKKAIKPNSSVKGEFLVRVPFEITKGADYDVAPTVNLLSKAVIAKSLINSGVTRDAFKKSLRDAATEALNRGDDVAETLTDADKRILAMVEDIEREVIAELPRQPRNGITKVKILTETGLPEIISQEINA